jgi:transposase
MDLPRRPPQKEVLMANRLKMAIAQSILTLHERGWSARRIARELGVDRETVSQYVRRSPPAERRLDGSNPANAPISPAGESALSNAAAPVGDGARGRRSNCQAWLEAIEAKQAQGLSARRIHQDLVSEHGAAVSYDSVRRFLKRIGWTRPLPFRRLECAPGQEAQVDFGSGAPIIRPDGKRRRTHVFRIVLSHSRKAYSEATYWQTTDDFLQALESAFEHFGGAPQTLVIDNLKAAVKHPDWYDPELVPKVAAFAAHYGTTILPTKPYTPRHKGKVESSVKYVKNNGLKGRAFETLELENQFLLDWETSVADTRIHGTTRQHVGRVFGEVERSTLRPLPTERFPNFHEAQRSVNRDGHVEVAKAYYSAPPEYLGRRVWVRWDGRTVRIFNHRFEQIAMHVRREPGRFSTLGEHLAIEKISGVERGATWLLHKAAGVGEHAQAWAEEMLHARGVEGLRVLQGLLALSKQRPDDAVNEACRTALTYRAFQLRTVRQLVKRRGAVQPPLPFLDEHPLIRPLADYGAWVRTALADPWGKNQRPQVLPPDPHLLPSSLIPS